MPEASALIFNGRKVLRVRRLRVVGIVHPSYPLSLAGLHKNLWVDADFEGAVRAWSNQRRPLCVKLKKARQKDSHLGRLADFGPAVYNSL